MEVLFFLKGGIVSATTSQINKNSNLEAFQSVTENCVVSDTIPKGKEDQEVLDEAWEERAAIMQYEGGMTHEEAEARAREMLDPDRE